MGAVQGYESALNLIFIFTFIDFINWIKTKDNLLIWKNKVLLFASGIFYYIFSLE